MRSKKKETKKNKPKKQLKPWEAVGITHLKYLILLNRINQSRLSKELGMCDSKLSKIINGWRPASPRDRKLICKYFKIPQSKLEIDLTHHHAALYHDSLKELNESIHPKAKKMARK